MQIKELFSNSGCFLLISRSAFPIDLRTYSLSSSLLFASKSIAACGLSLKYGRLVHTRNPSETARRTFALSLPCHFLVTSYFNFHKASLLSYIKNTFFFISCTSRNTVLFVTSSFAAISSTLIL